MKGKPNFDRFMEMYEQWYIKLPYIVSTMAVEDIIKNFSPRQGSYIDGSLTAWKRRKKDKDPGRAILIGPGGGRLWRSLRPEPQPETARVVTDVPYAQIHNEGGEIMGVVTVPEHTRRTKSGETTVKEHEMKMNTIMPPRPFMLTSPEFDAALEKKIHDDLEDMFFKSIE